MQFRVAGRPLGDDLDRAAVWRSRSPTRAPVRPPLHIGHAIVTSGAGGTPLVFRSRQAGTVRSTLARPVRGRAVRALDRHARAGRSVRPRAGTIVTRARIEVDPVTAQNHGPLRPMSHCSRSSKACRPKHPLDRRGRRPAGLLLQPDDCAPQSSGTATAVGGASAHASPRRSPLARPALKFTPHLTASTSSKPRKPMVPA